MKSWEQQFAKSAFLRSADIAHDLKTPLNIAVLNLELLRMRVAKLTAENPDKKINAYAKSVEFELRRIAQIVDVFFLLSVPPRSEPEPGPHEVRPLIEEAAERARIPLTAGAGDLVVGCHLGRARELFRLFFEGLSRLSLASPEGKVLSKSGKLVLEVEGSTPSSELEASKLFKFYYTDSSGNPELSLASARLIAETYGGDVEAEDLGGGLRVTLSLPLGER